MVEESETCEAQIIGSSLPPVGSAISYAARRGDEKEEEEKKEGEKKNGRCMWDFRLWMTRL